MSLSKDTLDPLNRSSDLSMDNPLDTLLQDNFEKTTNEWIEVSKQFELKGDFTGSTIGYQLALESPSNNRKENYQIYSGLGRIRSKMGRFYEAIYAFERAKQNSSIGTVNWDELQSIFDQVDDKIFDESTPSRIMQLFELDKENPTTWTAIGSQFLLSGRFEDGEYCFKRASHIDPGDMNAVKGLRIAYKHQLKPNRSI